MVDALCLDDLDANGTELDDPIAELYQDLYHRIALEAPGSNLDDPARGYGLVGRLSGAGKRAALSADIKHGIESECRKDSRVLDARADVTETAPGEYLIALAIVPSEDELGVSLVPGGAYGLTIATDGAGARRVP